ncbi:Epiplakin [Amphibalanus amphitrite]|uniref:Epiplakin n=1 Tax=Amphibalanus amphitrite TaxID=1232801 RepID=A0A6A4VXE7_AMPAM|nr:Epiplakin [Amphibalanus amphitrite]
MLGEVGRKKWCKNRRLSGFLRRIAVDTRSVGKAASGGEPCGSVRRYYMSRRKADSTDPEQEGSYVTSMVTEGEMEPHTSSTSYSYSSPDGGETTVSRQVRSYTYSSSSSGAPVTESSSRSVRTHSYRIEADGAAGQLLNVAGVTHPETGEALTLGEATRRRLFEPRRGCFVHPSTGARHSVDEAVDVGLLDTSLRQLMHQRSGVFDGRSDRPLTLLEAMMDGLMDPQESMFVGPAAAERPRQVSEEPSASDRPTLLEAVIAGQVDTDSGQVTDPDSGRRYPLPEAFDRGLLSLAHDYTRMCGVSLLGRRAAGTC